MVSTYFALVISVACCCFCFETGSFYIDLAVLELQYVDQAGVTQRSAFFSLGLKTCITTPRLSSDRNTTERPL